MELGVTGWELFFWVLAWTAVVAAGAVFLYGHRLRKADGERFGNLRTLMRLTPDDYWKSDEHAMKARYASPEAVSRNVRRMLRTRRNIKIVMFLLGMAAAVFAFGRPRWGTLQEKVFKKGIDIVLLVDTSLSMKAEDVAPNRLEKARSEISSLLNQLENNRVGLVGFAYTTRLHCPLTLDFRGLKSILKNSLSFGKGTNIQNAVEVALKVLKNSQARAKAIVLLSDGEGHQGDVDAVIRRVKAEGVRIFCIGIGTPEGGPIPEESEDGATGYKKKDGKLVWTRLEEEPLIRLARESGGKYFRATNSETETLELAAAIGQMEKTEFSQTVTTRKAERFSIFVFIAVILLSLEAALGDFRASAWEEE